MRLIGLSGPGGTPDQPDVMVWIDPRRVVAVVDIVVPRVVGDPAVRARSRVETTGGVWTVFGRSGEVAAAVAGHGAVAAAYGQPMQVSPVEAARARAMYEAGE